MAQPINRQMLVDFILGEVSEKQQKRILKEIENDEIIRGWYLQEKRKLDIEKYLDNDMSVGERIELEELLKKDMKLKKDFVLSKDINEFLKIEIFMEQLDEIHKEHDDISEELCFDKNNTPVKKLNSKIIKIGKWVAAASIVLFITFSGTKYISNRDSIENRLYAKYYEPFINEEMHYFNSSALSEAKKQYINKEFKVSLMLLENLPNSLTIETEKYMYLGLIYMENENYNDATKSFSYLLDHYDNETVISISEWYLGLCYLKMKKKQEAIELFDMNVKHFGYNYKEASKILEELR